MLIINNRFLSLYDYNFLLVNQGLEKIFSVKPKTKQQRALPRLLHYIFHFVTFSRFLSLIFRTAHRTAERFQESLVPVVTKEKTRRQRQELLSCRANRKLSVSVSHLLRNQRLPGRKRRSAKSQACDSREKTINRTIVRSVSCVVNEMKKAISLTQLGDRESDVGWSLSQPVRHSADKRGALNKSHQRTAPRLKVSSHRNPLKTLRWFSFPFISLGTNL